MLEKRIIPVISFHKEEFIKTINFKNRQYIGDPLNAIKIFNEKFVDEIIILDIGSESRESTKIDFKYIKNLIDECFMPVTYGGNIQNLDDAKKLFDLGIDKISLNNSILKNFLFINELSNYFGTQSISVSVDVTKTSLGDYKIYNYKNDKLYERYDLKEYLTEIEKNGAGEIIINSVHKDGLMTGMDLNLAKLIKDEIDVPLVFYGGVGKLSHLNEVFSKGIDAIACSSFFCFHGDFKSILITYPFEELEKIKHNDHL
jgi:cyclase|tara:strand:+ start:1496 stop:2269 length:774 start_codon:yes stop_codon:yes gene_type:complete